MARAIGTGCEAEVLAVMVGTTSAWARIDLLASVIVVEQVIAV